MDKLNQRQLTLIKRAAEDAIHACNRHYGPFVDVVAHPLNIIALVEMAQSRQAELDEKDKRIGDQKDFIEMALNSLNHLKENAVTHRDYGHECNWVRSFNDLIKLADDAEDSLKQAL